MKAVVQRVIYIDADLDPFQVVMRPGGIDLLDGQTVAQWITERKAAGETAYDMAQECDLFDGVAVNFQVVEHYEDGSKKCVERATWRDSDADGAA